MLWPFLIIGILLFGVALYRKTEAGFLLGWLKRLVRRVKTAIYRKMGIFKILAAPYPMEIHSANCSTVEALNNEIERASKEGKSSTVEGVIHSVEELSILLRSPDLKDAEYGTLLSLLKASDLNDRLQREVSDHPIASIRGALTLGESKEADELLEMAIRELMKKTKQFPIGQFPVQPHRVQKLWNKLKPRSLNGQGSQSGQDQDLSKREGR